jgi:hypothetical protein
MTHPLAHDTWWLPFGTVLRGKGILRQLFSAPHPTLQCPTDPSLYRDHLCRVFKIPPADVIDLTGYVDRSEFIAAGGSGDIWKGAWKGVDGSPLSQMLPSVAVKLIKLVPVKEGEKDKRFKVSISGILDGSRQLMK